jgi:hypothetical protein
MDWLSAVRIGVVDCLEFWSGVQFGVQLQTWLPEVTMARWTGWLGWKLNLVDTKVELETELGC